MGADPIPDNPIEATADPDGSVEAAASEPAAAGSPTADAAPSTPPGTGSEPTSSRTSTATAVAGESRDEFTVADFADPPPPDPNLRRPGWRKRTATGAILSGLALGFQQVFEEKKEDVSIIMETSGEPPQDLPVEAEFDGAAPRRSVVKIRPWLLPDHGEAAADSETAGDSETETAADNETAAAAEKAEAGESAELNAADDAAVAPEPASDRPANDRPANDRAASDLPAGD